MRFAVDSECLRVIPFIKFKFKCIKKLIWYLHNNMTSGGAFKINFWKVYWPQWYVIWWFGNIKSNLIIVFIPVYIENINHIDNIQYQLISCVPKRNLCWFSWYTFIIFYGGSLGINEKLLMIYGLLFLLTIICIL